jgi:hypothetical protein
MALEEQSESSFTIVFLSCMIAIITTSIFTSVVQDSIIKPRLYDGSVNELGRYSMTFDAYNHIAEESDNAFIAIGSSKMREALDGILIGEKFNNSFDFYNLAVAGDRPYVRMLEIEAIIAANPKYVIFEVGPNTFSSLSTPVPDSTLSRMKHLSSLGHVDFSQYPESVLNDLDRDLLPTSHLSQKEHIAAYTLEAIEDTIEIEILNEDQPWRCEGKSANVRCVPLPNNSTFDNYLKYPTQFSNKLELVKAGKSQWTLEEYYGERLDNYIQGSYHNPEELINKNQIAFEYMIERLIEVNIEVILVGLPYNPVLLDRLEDKQWEYYNQTISNYRNLETLYVIDMLWDDDWQESHFNDYTHMSREGEILFADKLSTNISKLLEIPIILHEILEQNYNCYGNNEQFTIEEGNLLIEAEEYSFCEFGKNGIDSIWEIESTFVNYSGDGYVAALPDVGTNAFDTTNGPLVGYNISVQTNGTHHIWVSFAASNGGGDSIHLGLNGNPLTYGGVGFGTADNNAWNWKKIEVNISSIGKNSLEVWMREDGVMIDSIIITTDLSYDPRKVSN